MKILVTGGAGFIGSHIVDALIARGHQVSVVDNLSTGLERNLNPKARFYKLSIGEAALSQVLEKERPQVVSHHAAQWTVHRSVREPLFDAQENILGSLNLLLLCRQFGVKKVIYASSGGQVYGEPDYLPVDEDHPIRPLSPYGISKHTVEHYLYLYAQQATIQSGQGGPEYVVFRYANVYGPRQNPQGEAGVVAIFAGQMLRGKRPTIFGKGDKTRDYIHVSDVVSANLLALPIGKGLALGQGHNQIYNLGSGVETSDKEIFEAIARAAGFKAKAQYAPVRPGELYRICLKTEKAQRELGWRPAISLKEGLAQTVAYYEGLLATSPRPASGGCPPSP